MLDSILGLRDPTVAECGQWDGSCQTDAGARSQSDLTPSPCSANSHSRGADRIARVDASKRRKRESCVRMTLLVVASSASKMECESCNRPALTHRTFNAMPARTAHPVNPALVPPCAALHHVSCFHPVTAAPLRAPLPEAASRATRNSPDPNG